MGYTPEEARFIYIVATHSGYFTHRQFLEFSGTKPGKHSQKFLTKLLTHKHATYHTYQSGGRVYHIFSRKVFKAIDRDDLRTRRRHQLDYIKTRVVALDFVLSNLNCEYLETEAEKVPFFESELKVSRCLFCHRKCTLQRSLGNQHNPLFRGPIPDLFEGQFTGFTCRRLHVYGRRFCNASRVHNPPSSVPCAASVSARIRIHLCRAHRSFLQGELGRSFRGSC